MKRLELLACLSGLMLTGSALAQSGARVRESYEIEYGIPLYYDAMIRQLTYPLAWDKAGMADFGAWRKTAREKLLECLLTPPPAVPFDCEVVAREKRDGYEAQKIRFNISGFARVPAYLLVPDGEGPFPALVMLHDHGAEFFIGKEKMVRPFDVPAAVSDRAQEWVDQLYGGNFVGDDYARRGYVVLSVDALFWGERGRREGVDYNFQQALSANLQQLGMTWTGVITWDDVRSVDFLASLPFVDSARIGAVGFSMGAHRAWMLSAASDRVAAAAAICWMNTTEYLMRPNNNQLKGGSAYAMLVPNLRNYLDYPHVASIACPRALLFFNGRRDKLFPVEGVEDAYGIMRSVWNGQGAGDDLVTKLWDTLHIFNADMQREVDVFLDKYLQK